MRLLVVGAMMAIAMPAAGGQFMKIEDIKGESRNDARCANVPDIVTGAGPGGGPRARLTVRKSGGDGEAVQGSLDRDIIRRIPRGPKPKAQEARNGVQVAAGDVTGDGASKPGRTKVRDITLKRGAAPKGC